MGTHKPVAPELRAAFHVHALFVQVIGNSRDVFGGWRFEGLATDAAQLAAFTTSVKHDIAATAHLAAKTKAFKVVDLEATIKECDHDGECCNKVND